MTAHGRGEPGREAPRARVAMAVDEIKEEEPWRSACALRLGKALAIRDLFGHKNKRQQNSKDGDQLNKI